MTTKENKKPCSVSVAQIIVYARMMKSQEDSMEQKDIIDFLNEELKDSDKISEVEDWIREDPENRTSAESMYYTLHSLKSLKIMEDTDTGKAYEKFQQSVKENRRSIFIRNFVRSLEKIAAILILPLGIALGYLLYTGHSFETPMVEVNSQTGTVSKVVLPDGSVAWLSSSSSLKYPLHFKGKTREVVLFGQGYFDVAKNEKKPFIVNTPYNYSVEALGTEFAVCARENENTLETTLVEGLVRVDYNDAIRKFSQIIYPDQCLTYNKKTGKLTLDVVNSGLKTSWKDQCLIFKETPMSEVLTSLERFYNVEFKVDNWDTLKNSKITAYFKDESVYQILGYLELTSNIKYKILKNTAYGNSTSTTLIEIRE